MRCLVKRPDLLVVDGALAPFGEVQRRSLASLLHEATDGRSLIMVLPNDRESEGFGALIRFRQGKAELETLGPPRPGPETHPSIDEEEAETVKPVGKRVAGGVA